MSWTGKMSVEYHQLSNTYVSESVNYVLKLPNKQANRKWHHPPALLCTHNNVHHFSFSVRRKSLLTSLSASKQKSWNTRCEREHRLSLCRLFPSTSGWLNCRSASTISWTLMSHRDDSSASTGAWTLKTPGCSSSEALRLWAVRSHKRLSGSEGSVSPSRPETWHYSDQ